MHIGLSGRYKLEAVKADGTKRDLTGWFENLILDSGLERMGEGAYIDRCVVGTGTTDPSVLQTALVSQIASTTSISPGFGWTVTSTTSSPYYAYGRITYRFATGVATGNLTEVGVGWASGLFSRSLIKDGSGNPTTITVLSDESLDVTYELRLYPPLTDSTYNVTISGVEYSFTGRAANVTSINTSYFYINQSVGGKTSSTSDARVYNGTLGAITSLPSGTASSMGNSSDIVNSAYVAGSLYRDMTITFTLTAGNVSGGVTAMKVDTTLGVFQFGVSPAIPKDASKVLTLNARLSWGRYVA